MSARLAVLLAGLVLPLAGSADEPDIRPGKWEYTSTSRFEGAMGLPEQTYSNQECITQEDIAQGQAFLQDLEDCEVTRMDVRRSGMTYALICRQQGMEMHMDAEMRFMGDRAEGNMKARMDTPMGPMQMHMDMKGHRLGDC